MATKKAIKRITTIEKQIKILQIELEQLSIELRDTGFHNVGVQLDKVNTVGEKISVLERGNWLNQ